MGDRRNEPVGAGMRILPVLALGLVFGLAALPQSATAQVFGGWGGWGNGGFWTNGGNDDGLQPRQVRRSIAEQGFRVISPMRRNGSVFVADVLDRRGRRERLIVAAADAQILQRFYLDDSRGAAPRETEQQPSFASRFFGDTEPGPTPPAPIPSLGRRPGVPNENATQTRRYGDLDDGGDTALVPALPVRPQPPIRTVKPRPRFVERTPDATGPVRLPGAVDASPLNPATPSPAAPRPKLVEPARAPSGPSPSPKVASRPDVPPTAPVAPPSRRPADPLALPGTPNAAEASTPPVRSVSGGITGTPAATPSAAASPAPAVAPPKTGDVPVAPLD